jgi:hypothetical protein
MSTLLATFNKLLSLNFFAFFLSGDTASDGRFPCTRLEQNWYVQDYSDDVIISLKDVLGIDLSRKYLPLVDIKKMLGATKKVAV